MGYSLDQKGQQETKSSGILGQDAYNNRAGLFGIFTNVATGQSSLTASPSVTAEQGGKVNWWLVIGAVVLAAVLWKFFRAKK